jgi:hypothetical protein
MSIALSVAAAMVVLLVIAFVVVMTGFARRKPEPAADLDWCRTFSVAKYRPMERLFVQEDYEFLSSQPGFKPEIYRRLQAERRRVFRRYLRSLSGDFDRLLGVAKTLILNSAEDRPDLAKMLMRQRLTFSYALATVHMRLALQGLGLGTVDVRPLVGALDSLRLELRSLSLAEQASAA